MEKNKNYVDLHIHTNKSDGVFSPKEIVRIANENNTNLISICDHDTIKGIPELQTNLLKNMKCVNGVEFSSYLNTEERKIKLHILGYGFNENSTTLLNLLEEMKQKRILAHKRVLNFFKETLLSLPEESISELDMERYCWFDREIIKCLEKESYNLEIIEQLKKHFKNCRFSYGNDYEIESSRVIETIKSSGGIAVLAHPMTYKLSREEIVKVIKKLAFIGIDGIEIYQSDCSLDDIKYLMDIANKYDLLCSAGRDFHRIINSDGREIGKGINGNLCVEETSLSNEILEKKLFFEGNK